MALLVIFILIVSLSFLHWKFGKEPAATNSTAGTTTPARSLPPISLVSGINPSEDKKNTLRNRVITKNHDNASSSSHRLEPSDSSHAMSPTTSVEPATSKSSTQVLMPPPPRPSSTSTQSLPQTPSFTSSTFSRGPLPNRGPPGGPNGNASLLPPATASRPPSQPAAVNKARNKVVLAPGHSPLDWAILTRTSKDLSGVPRLQRVTKSQLAQYNGRKGRPAWSSFQGKVYNITPYLPFHPGGVGELMRGAGKDGTKLFMDNHPWVNWENMLGDCLVGFLVGDAEVNVGDKSAMEEMD